MFKFQGKIKALALSIFIFPLIGCGLEDDKKQSNENYSGPVQGISQNIYSEDSTTPSVNIDTNSSAVDSNVFGENKRFMKKSSGVLGDVQYISSPAVKYNFGLLLVNGKGDWESKGQPKQTTTRDVRIVPFTGWIRYPKVNLNNKKNKFPIIVFLHGQHSIKDPSYQGYDYMAKTLAEQGYVVLSIDANEINGTGGDLSSQSRAQLVLGTIDKLKQLNEFGGAGLLTELKDRLDFDRMGIMGHSRGGQGIYLTIKLNTTRFGNDLALFKKALVEHPKNFSKYPELIAFVKNNPTQNLNQNLVSDEDDQKLLALIKKYNISFAKTTNAVKPYNFRAAFALAPTDFEEIKGITNVPTATLIPTCDGDVNDLQGVNNYDNNRFSLKYDTAPKYQVWVRGANHNYYNTTWVEDDYKVGNTITSDSNKIAYCDESRPNSIRLNATEQRNMGQFLMNSFMRYFVGNEEQFKEYWNGVAQLPKSACPTGNETCDERVILTIQKNDHKLIQRFEDTNAISINQLGRSNKLTGFLPNGIVACKSYLGKKDESDKESKCFIENVPKFYKLAETESGGLASSADQLQLTWNTANPTYQLDLNYLSTQGYDSLTFRVAVPLDLGQEIFIELTDAQGKVARVTVSDFTDALYVVPRKKKDGIPLVSVKDDEIFKAKVIEGLNMVSIPLKAFEGIDTSHLKQLVFKFPKESGTIVMSDIQLQSLRK